MNAADLPYVIVQAGGKGTRLGHLTDNMPKALVPVENKPMIFHLFDLYPKAKYIIITDYKSDVMARYLEAFAPVEYLIVDCGGVQGTCAGIGRAVSKVPEHTPFMLVWSDLVLPPSFKTPPLDHDCIGISKDFSCRWRFENGRFEEVPSDVQGVAGLWTFQDRSSLANVPASGEFVRWLQGQGLSFEEIPLHHTREYGLLSEYNKIETGNIGSRCRPFNRITVKDGMLIKEGIDEQGRRLAVREKAWYRYVSEKGFAAIPKITSYEPLCMEKINGKNIFLYDFTHEERKQVLKKLVGCLKSLHELESVPADAFSLYDAYVGKTLGRLDKIRNMVPFGDERMITVNGRRCRNIFFYRDVFRKLFNHYHRKAFCLIHGDNTFSNSMLNECMEPILIDPRGYFGHTEIFGDVAYDWAKLYYSIVGNYDQFNTRHFRLSIKETGIDLSIASNGWEDMEEMFFELVADDVTREEIKLIHAITWLSLTTYAWEDYDAICGAFYNGLYYLEEVL